MKLNTVYIIEGNQKQSSSLNLLLRLPMVVVWLHYWWPGLWRWWLLLKLGGSGGGNGRNRRKDSRSCGGNNNIRGQRNSGGNGHLNNGRMSFALHCMTFWKVIAEVIKEKVISVKIKRISRYATWGKSVVSSMYYGFFIRPTH